MTFRGMSPVAVSIGTIAVIGAMLLPGCAKRDTESDARPKIALVMKSLANEFFKTMEEGARAHHLEHSDAYDLKVVGIANEQDVAQQVDFVEMMIAQDVDAIVLAPADSKALIPVCIKALKAGVAVVNIDNKLDEALQESKGIDIPFVGPDNRKGAALAARYLADRLKPGDEVAIIEGAPNAFNGIQRKAGFEDAVKAAQLKIVSSQSGYWETDKAMECVSAIVSEYPNLKAVLCANDSMALGAVSAIKAAGKTETVRVVGFDNIGAVQKLVKAGSVLCTVDQHGDKLAVYGIEYALEILTNKTTPADKETPVDLITADNLE